MYIYLFVKHKQPVISIKKLMVCYENLNRKNISIDCFRKQLVVFITEFC